jgi:hypothetical protein
LVALGRYLVFTDDVEIFCDCGIDSYWFTIRELQRKC